MMMKKKKNPENFCNMKRKTHSIQYPEPHILFALILAALHSSDSRRSSNLINLCLNRLRRSISRNAFPDAILSLLPILLKSESNNIVHKALELVGAASLTSIERNGMIASEDGILVSLISLIGNSARELSMAACHAVLDLSTTSVGRSRLLKFSVLEKLFVSFNQVQMSLPAVIRLSCNAEGNESCSRIVFEKENSSILLLEATLLLIKSCTIKQLEEIPKNLSESLSIHLKGMWEKVHSFMLCDTVEWKHAGDNIVSNIRANDVAESIFRLCVGNLKCGEHPNVKQIQEIIFCLGKIDFEQFIFDYWEESSLLLRGMPKASPQEDHIFSSLAKSFQSIEMPFLLPSMLKDLTSCPPIASDELDISHFLEEVRDHFGCPIIYNQDIRVVKTHQSEGELHYFVPKFSSCSSQSSNILHFNEILKCMEAYSDGYTIALRGMEFRFRNIATIADGLASLFGQPSAGVNMYLTPPDSQGLSCHSDDHCVFVCQISGTKQWNIFPGSRVHLPRLYESISNSVVENEPLGESKQFLLQEGDILYIPRGFPHEARTTMDKDGSAGFSLHLTLAIEVELPFEWEGFVHVAIYHWNRKHRDFHQPSNGSISLNLHVMSVNLLHVVVMLIGDSDPTFRKACLVGQISSSTVSEGSITLNQKVIFQHLITKINDESKFTDLEHLEMAVRKHEDLFHRLRWMKNLSWEEEMLESQKSSIFTVDANYILQFCSQHKGTLQGALMETKSNFCKEIVVEDVEQEYKMLLDRYKKVRRQYTEGMLSLHLTGD